MRKAKDAEARSEVHSDAHEGKTGLRPEEDRPPAGGRPPAGSSLWGREVSSSGRSVPQAREGSGPLRGLSRRERGALSLRASLQVEPRRVCLHTAVQVAGFCRFAAVAGCARI